MQDKVNYTLPTREQKKQRELAKKQANCFHSQWSKRCALCSLVLESDTQINVNTCTKLEVAGYQVKLEIVEANFDSGILRLFEAERHFTLLNGTLDIKISETPFSKEGRYLAIRLNKGSMIKVRRDFYYQFSTHNKQAVVLVTDCL